MIVFTGCSSDEDESIQKKIDKANYCEVKEDCAYAGSKCPFGCYIYVNINEYEEISQLIEDYNSECAYGCLKCEDVACFENRCVANC